MSNKIKSLSYGSIALLQPLQKWLNDGRVSEVMLNKQKEVWIEKNGIITKHEVPELGDRHLACLFQLLANENKQRISQENPLLSGSLPDGSRVQLCLPPTAKDYCFAIRRQVVTDLSLDDYDNRFFIVVVGRRVRVWIPPSCPSPKGEGTPVWKVVFKGE